MSYRVVLVTSSKAVPVSHLISAEASGPPWFTLCDRQIWGRVLAPAEVDQVTQCPCLRCARVAGPVAMRAYEREE
jgi:hypothetical protein